MCEALLTPENLQFRRRCQMGVGLSLLIYIACNQAASRVHNPALGLTLSGIAGAAVFAELVTAGMLVLGLRDEFQRALLTRSFLWGSLITMAFSIVWGSLEAHSRSTVPHMDVIWVPAILVCVTAGAKLLIFRRHRPEND